MNLPTELLTKYDVPVPRYTSYPTVPYWDQVPTSEQWVEELRKATGDSSSSSISWSLYVHIPFCETLCTFCGCNTVITKDHGREAPYVKTILSEMEIYLKTNPELFRRPLQQLHLGGGTPTFLSAAQLDYLLEQIFQHVKINSSHFEGSIEVDPRRTSQEQLRVLKDFGFNRVSLGVQDFHPEVQRLVNRHQPLEQTRALTEVCRQLGYVSVNYDLIYGLPKQTLESFSRTVEQTIALSPDRLALYSFARVPWIKPQQRLFKDEDLPVGFEKRKLYERAYQLLTQAGYVEIGMDHFAKENEALAQALKKKTLHRNFMGYTDQRTDILLGLGVSAISETPTCFHQNEKLLPIYERHLREGKIPSFRGHLLSEEDQMQRQLILKFMTELEVQFPSDEAVIDAQNFLKEMIMDNLVQFVGRTLILTPQGRPFLRNACAVLDKKMRRAQPHTRIFSQAV